MGEKIEKKPPAEIVRCLRICRSPGKLCTDAQGVPCSYRNPNAKSFECILRLIGDSADALAAAYLKGGRGL